MILSAQTIRKRGIITPFHERSVFEGLSFGLSTCGYDIRIAEDVLLNSSIYMKFRLTSSIEHFDMPNDVVGRVHDKSTWARQGLTVQNTIIEPGWRGYLTLELTTHGIEHFTIKKGTPIAQVVFELLDEPTDNPYAGKYQDQREGPVSAKFEK